MPFDAPVPGWATAAVPTLRVELLPPVRAALSGWLAQYGALNGWLGFASGPLDRRLERLRDRLQTPLVLAWMSPERWAQQGPHLLLHLPRVGLEFGCGLEAGRLVAHEIGGAAEAPPDQQPGTVGLVLSVGRVLLAAPGSAAPPRDPGVSAIVAHLPAREMRWTEFVAPLRRLLEAEAQAEQARARWLRAPFRQASPDRTPGRNVWHLHDVPEAVARALASGEWLDLLDHQGCPAGGARVLDTPGPGVLRVDAGDAPDLPRQGGQLAPRARGKILGQKRAVLDELAQPTGNLAHLVRLMAAPEAVPAPSACPPRAFANPAVGRVAAQSRAVALARGLREGEALLIHGPPGTGKSTTAAEINVQLIQRDPGVRILVCSHSNHGTDNLLARLLPFLEDAAGRVARVGFYERVAAISRPFFVPPDADLGDRNVVFTTIDALALQDAAGARLYDYVILDEANRAGVLDSALALARGRRLILVGDPLQLAPVLPPAAESLLDQESSSEVIGTSFFAWIRDRGLAPGALVLLDEQNRMHPTLGQIVSDLFYAGALHSGPKAPRELLATPRFCSPLTWVDTRALAGGEQRAEGGQSLANAAEAGALAEALDHLAAALPPEASIGVITAYAEQRRLLRELIGSPPWAERRQLEIDTVDAFEGRERDVIVLSLVRSNARGAVGFLRAAARLNVAISRARRLLVVFGDTRTLGHDALLARLLAAAEALPGGLVLLDSPPRGGVN